jgi:hypothetical protein
MVMKQALRVLIAVTAVASLVGLAVPTTAHAQGCTVATLKGGYGFTTPNGFTRPTPSSSRFVPEIAAGLVTFDGRGGFTGKATNVTNGDTAPETPPFQFALVGTYTLDSDCTGSLTEINSGTHLEIVVVDSGKEVSAIQTDLQETRTFDFKKIRVPDNND